MPYKDKEKQLAFQRQRRKKHLPEYAERQKKYYLNNPGVYLRNVCKARAKKLGVPFNLTAEDFMIPDICPVLGIPIERGTKGFHDNAASVDRHIPELGYVKGNITIISFRANRLKGNAHWEEILKVAEYAKKLQKNWEVDGPVKETDDRASLDALRRLFSGENPPPMEKHIYEPEQEAGIGFCTICFNDNENDGNHLVA